MLAQRQSSGSILCVGFACCYKEQWYRSSTGSLGTREEVEEAERDSRGFLGTGLQTQTHKPSYSSLCLSCQQLEEAEGSVYDLGVKMIQIIFNQKAVKDMVSGRSTKSGREEWEPSLSVEGEDKPVRRVTREKGFEGQKESKWALNVRRAQHT